MLPNLGYGELLIILILALLLFGPNKIPELARNLGRSISGFKQGMKEGLEEDPKKTHAVDPNDKKA